MPSQSSPLDALTQTRRTGDEPFHSNLLSDEFNLVEFWQWSTSDLISNATRGRLAEFLVAKALGLAYGTRVEWDAYDLLLHSGVKIEVKSSAYLQSWRQLRLSPISFSIPLTRAWKEEDRAYDANPLRQADIYVFAILAHEDKSTVDALDLDQWYFYVVPTKQLNELKEAKSISLKTLQTLCPNPSSWFDLAAKVGEVEARIPSSK